MFSDELYTSFKRFLSPPLHLTENGKNISYSRRQIEIIHSQNRQQRIKGVVGSGKTTILAARAVEAYKRTKGKILILTYNITLKNYIHDKISQVRAEFPWENFTILNYHTFINNELNNLGVDVGVPEKFNELSLEQKEKYFESNYYSNKQLFTDNVETIVQYDAIFIDEIQDYKRPWMEIIKEFFLVDGGEYVLFGDVKQNIYNFIRNCDLTGITNIGEEKLTVHEYRDHIMTVVNLSVIQNKAKGKNIVSLTTFNPRYSNPGVKGLTDGIFGGRHFNAGWLGYQGTIGFAGIDVGGHGSTW